MKAETARTLSLLRERPGGLGTLELRNLGINSPAARILELRNVYSIDAVWTRDIDAAGFSRKVSRYFYIGQRHEKY